MNKIHDEVLSTLRQLKWAISALNLGGLKDFPVSSVHGEGVDIRDPGEFGVPRGNTRPLGSTPNANPSLSMEPPLEADAGVKPGPQAFLRVPDECGIPRSNGDGGPGFSSFGGAGEGNEDSPDITGPHVSGRNDPEQALRSVQAEMGDCKRCRLHGGRKNLVFADGSHNARLVFVGEGPGFDEDQQGIPFVGRAGKLLDRMICALGLQRMEVYICNVVKCRPPNNRTPDKDEIELCSPFLFRQLEAVHPQVICALGACAAQTLLGNSNPISRLRGKVHHWRGIPLVCTFHPAYLLRNPAQKAAAWQDLLEIRGVMLNDK